MKQAIDKDEMWPVYSLSATDGYSLVVDVPDDLLERYLAVTKEFFIVNRALEQLYSDAKKTREKLT